MPEPDPYWREEAACIDAMSFAFPDAETLAKRNAEERRFVSAFCGGCAVKKECLYTAVTNQEEYGVWGGYITRDVRRIMHAYRVRYPSPVRQPSSRTRGAA